MAIGPTWLPPVTNLVRRPTPPVVRHSTTVSTFSASKLAAYGGIFRGGTRVASAAPPLRGITTLPDPDPYLTPVPYVRHHSSQSTFMPTTMLPYEEEEIVARAADDYVTRLYFGQLPLARTTIYTAPDDVNVTIIRQLSISNTTGVDQTAQVWIAGIKFIPTITVPFGMPPVGEDYPVLTLMSGEQLEAMASANGVNLFIDGIESVR